MNNKIKPSYKVISDHLRSSVFLISDGILPSNEGRGYVLRRIIRRALLHCHKINKNESFFYKLSSNFINEFCDDYPDIKLAEGLITNTLKSEEDKFRKTLENGITILDKEIEDLKKNNDNIFSGKIAFKLYDTYGFPLDLTSNILKESNIKINIDEFTSEMNIQKERAKKNWSGSSEEAEEDFFYNLKTKYGSTNFSGYNNIKDEARILSLISNQKEVSKIDENSKNVQIILDKTPFYATSGGQKGDDGFIFLSKDNKDDKTSHNQLNNIVNIKETKKVINSLYIHLADNIKGEFKVGDEITAIINYPNRQFKAQNHSATHLLHFALKEILGKQITQKGSNIENEYLTFDFNYNEAITQNKLDEVEDLINFYIRQNSDVITNIMKIDDAKKKGALALFGEKYDDEVRVLSMAKTNQGEDLSVELCGGTHINNTGNIGLFKIISEKGIASGIRRIEAKTGYFAFEYLRKQNKKLYALLDSLKIKENFTKEEAGKQKLYSLKRGFDDSLFFRNDDYKNEENQNNQEIENIHNLGLSKITELKNKDKEIEKLKKELLNNNLSKFANIKISKINLIHHTFEGLSAKELRDLILGLKSKKEYQNNTVFLFFAIFEEKISICLAISKDLTEKLNAGSLIPQIVEMIGGKGGGGKPDLAFGGGFNKNGIKDAISKLTEYLK
jgi:alanyl-tRNA synthetase